MSQIDVIPSSFKETNCKAYTLLPTWDIGDRVMCRAEFRDSGGELIDPQTINTQVLSPSGIINQFFYIQSTPISSGIYEFPVDPDEAGVWYYQFVATGTGQSVGENYFTVRQKNVQ